MIQFSLNRFGKLAQWSLTNDRKYYVKSFLQVFVIMLLGFLFFPTTIKSYDHMGGYHACCIMIVIMLLVTVVLGPSFMYYSMENKHDMQNLLMLPASNFEKYLMRYASWIFLIPLYLVAFFGADLLQYVVHWILGHDYVVFVSTTLANRISDTWREMPDSLRYTAVNTIIILAIWFHPLYALGATFFRSRKFNWVLTTIVIVLLTIVQMWIFPFEEHTSYKETTTSIVFGYVFAVCWAILSFWLSYKLFCRTQVIGRFVNL